MLDKSTRKRIWNQLREIALVDGELDREEQELMINIIVNVEQYSHLMEDALADGIISETEERRLFEARMSIMEKAYEKAREDQIITPQEQELLKKMCQIIRDMN